MSGSSGGYCPICEKNYGSDADRCPVHGFRFQSRDALRPGVVIDGKFEILQRLGAGGMGETHLVRHAYLGEELVLKRIRPELAEDPLYQKSFLREAHSLAALRKVAAVVEIRDAWQTSEGYLALLLEYVEGGNLLQWLDTARGGGPLEVTEAVAIAADLAKALAAAHAIGILHRDVKPQNILMRPLEGGAFQLKLCDFGLAVQRVEEMTRQGTATAAMGTPGYAAPEQFALPSREQDARVDVFGLGMTLYRLVAGRLPWDTSAATWPLVCREQLRKSLKDLRPALAGERWLENLLVRLTAVERDDRIATAAEALELMQEALAETRPALATVVVPQPSVPPPVELQQSSPPPPRATDVAVTLPEMPGGTGEERHAESSASATMPATVPAPADGESAAGPTLPPEPTLPPPVGLGPKSHSKRTMALAVSGFAAIALLMFVWWALQGPKEVPDNPPAPVEEGNQTPAPRSAAPHVDDGFVPDAPSKQAPAPRPVPPSQAPEEPNGSYWQVGAFRTAAEAEPMLRALRGGGMPATLKSDPNGSARVLVGPYSDAQSLGRAKNELETHFGIRNPRAVPASTSASTAAAAVAAGRAGATKVNPKDGLSYVWIPPGTFMMGCSPGDTQCSSDEKPAHQVTITRGFWFGQTPVTQQAYQRVTGQNPSRFKGADLPVETVNWDEAKAYCAAVGGRLPTEAEWEYAARAGSTGARYGNLDKIAWYSENSGGKTHEVGQKLANAFGLYDMLGNVWQWVADWSGEYQPGAQADPSGAESGPAPRGGSWDSWEEEMRVSYRLRVDPDVRNNGIGLRCVGE